MEIRQVAFQGGVGETRSFKEYYEEKSLDLTGYWQEIRQRMLQLLTVLEEMHGPTLWACKSHMNMVLYDEDFQIHGRGESRVSVSTTDVFEVYVPLSETHLLWQSVVGRTSNVEEAARMVLEAVTKTLTVSTKARDSD